MAKPVQGGLELLDDPAAQRLLQSTQPAHLAYTWTDGTPRCTPIWFHWNGTDMVMAVPEEVRNKIVAQIPTGRLGSPEEIAYAVAFFIPDEASWITGANLSANGGQYMGW